ncbi:DUF5008 domain-containing protein [Sphingobacterium griseoflavum]|uniref:DUF5008 domain-containing protein n=1 Tax=Sphingobacterium griseoflavum TaxID=1474952 RepID=A0ABQ3HRB8_9SPHI|nr:DUF5008 domain-containing protein [Sphingobacterium griseoflavum]GHE23389.1 hypothetical protein GCM10017764_03570 [Sphingobacterium griseoflavum]
MMKTTITLFFGWLSIVLLMVSCNKNLQVGQDPYAGGQGSLGIGFLGNFPTPERARPGELVEFTVRGLTLHRANLEFFINDTPVELVSVQDSLVVIRVPEEISSGNAKVVVNNQVFYGPRLQIEGDASFDTNYGMVNGFNGPVNDFIDHLGGYIVVGNFSNFENQANNTSTFIQGIHFIDANGRTSSRMTFGKGGFGINSIARSSSGSFLLGGALSTFNGRPVQGMARIWPSGELDTMIVEVINTTENPLNSYDTVSAFNAGVRGSIVRVFGAADNKVVAVGNFDHHLHVDYSYSSRDNRHTIPTVARSIVRMHPDGRLDSTFLYNHSGANGVIADASQMPDGKIVIVGSFTSFNGRPAPGMVRLNTDGTIDETFAVGSAASRIQRISYNPVRRKFVVVGNFSSFNGVAAKGIVLLSENGTQDETFHFGEIEAARPLYGQLLNNGKMILHGTFERYNGVSRANLLLLEPDGSLVQRYNSFSPFTGTLQKVLEATSSTGRPALLLGGNISNFDAHRVGNFFRMEIRD